MTTTEIIEESRSNRLEREGSITVPFTVSRSTWNESWNEWNENCNLMKLKEKFVPNPQGGIIKIPPFVSSFFFVRSNLISGVSPFGTKNGEA
jgi:hypothetical protein